MTAAVYGIDAVGKAKCRFGKAVIVLQGYLYNGAVHCAGYVDGLAIEDLPVLIEPADKASYTTFKEECCLLVSSLIFEAYFQVLVQKSQLFEALADGIEVVVNLSEDFGVSQEGDGSSRFFRD